MSAAAVARWRQGQDYLTVTSPEGGRWMYDVTPDGDRPLSAFLHGTPWCAFPGPGWEQQDTGAGPAVWEVAVYPMSAAAALELGVHWPPGKVTGK